MPRSLPKVFQYQSEISKFISDFNKHEKKNIRTAANLIKKHIKKKAEAMKKTGNLKEGVYVKHMKTGASFVGVRRPAYHAYLLEFGHDARDGSFVEPHPVVYPTFIEQSGAVQKIIERPYS